VKKVFIFLLVLLLTILPITSQAQISYTYSNSFIITSEPQYYHISDILIVDLDLTYESDPTIELIMDAETLEHVLLWDGYHLANADWYRDPESDCHIYVKFNYKDICNFDSTVGLYLLFVSYCDDHLE